MKKIGLMTWYTYDNFGSLLQAYALEEIVIKMGYNIELINYMPKANYMLSSNYISRFFKKINKSMESYKMLEVERVDSSIKFSEFREKYLRIGAPAWTSNELYTLNRKYDAFICGSDQIWAPTVFDENYFLNFVSDNNKKISYAPSIGLPNIRNKIIKERMKKLIACIPNLSVREQQGSELIFQLCGKKAEVVLDPTLLLNMQDWDSILPKRDKEKYMLCYFLGENKQYIEIAKKLADKYQRELLIIPTNIQDFQYKEVITKPIGPIEFLNLVKNADCIFTDSFHGTAFSLNLNIPFLTFKRFKDNKLSQNSRIYNILDITNMKQRLYQNNYSFWEKNLLNVDFEECNKQLEKNRIISKKFLENSLRKACNTTEESKKQIITNLCTGCGVCECICPKDCISIMQNEKGFYEAKINQQECIQCNLCTKVCGQNIQRLSIPQIKEKRLVAGYVKDRKKLLAVASGGVCTFISEKAVENNIPVIGVRYNNQKKRAEHIVVNNREKLLELAGSKYLQSYTIQGFKEINHMENGIIIGTPCQISSIALYLMKKNKREKFLLIDLLCHGVPSYLLWNKYLNKKGKISNVQFRNKKYGWRNKTLSFNVKEKVYFEHEKNNLFYHFFNSEKIYNQACYECSYRDQSLADLRVADYWGPKYINVTDGRSMLIPITNAGDKIIEFLKREEKFVIEEGDIEDCLKYQQMNNLRIPLEYNQIFEDLKSKKTLKQLDYKYNLKYRTEVKVREFIKRVVNNG